MLRRGGRLRILAGNPLLHLFQILGTFIFLNLVVAVILENFSSLSSLDPSLVSASDIETFKDAWAELDPDADNYIPSRDLLTLVLRLPPPMGLNGAGDAVDAQRLILKLSIHQVDGNVAFQDVVAALTRHSYYAHKSVNSNDLDGLDVPEPPKPPPLPGSRAAQGKSGRTGADLFAEDLPSVRRVYALQVIEKHMQRKMGGSWKSTHQGQRDLNHYREVAVVPPAGYLATMPQTPPRLGSIHEEGEGSIGYSEVDVQLAENLLRTKEKRVRQPAANDFASHAATCEFRKPVGADAKPVIDTGRRRGGSRGASSGRPRQSARV